MDVHMTENEAWLLRQVRELQAENDALLSALHQERLAHEATKQERDSLALTLSAYHLARETEEQPKDEQGAKAVADKTSAGHPQLLVAAAPEDGQPPRASGSGANDPQLAAFIQLRALPNVAITGDFGPEQVAHCQQGFFQDLVNGSSFGTQVAGLWPNDATAIANLLFHDLLSGAVTHVNALLRSYAQGMPIVDNVSMAGVNTAPDAVRGFYQAVSLVKAYGSPKNETEVYQLKYAKYSYDLHQSLDVLKDLGNMHDHPDISQFVQSRNVAFKSSHRVDKVLKKWVHGEIADTKKIFDHLDSRAGVNGLVMTIGLGMIPILPKGILSALRDKVSSEKRLRVCQLFIKWFPWIGPICQNIQDHIVDPILSGQMVNTPEVNFPDSTPLVDALQMATGDVIRFPPDSDEGIEDAAKMEIGDDDAEYEDDEDYAFEL